MADTRSPAETEALGARLARRLRPGDVVLVSGELGSGKTTFIRGAARALGVEGPVTSPTFTIVREYDSGRLGLRHLDVYRLDHLHELGETSARLYGNDPNDGVGGDGAFFLLLDEPEVYGLPPDPVVPTRDAPEMWRTAGKAALAMAAAVAIAFLGRRS